MRQLQVTRHRPNEVEEPGLLSNLSKLPENMPATDNINKRIFVDFADGKAVTLTVRHNITENNAARSLASGAVVLTKAVSDSAVSLAFRGFSEETRFPIPIRGGCLKTRIARKSSYIEVSYLPLDQNTQLFTFNVLD